MTHEDAPHYSTKHPIGTPLDKLVVEALEARAVEGTITCAQAFVVVDHLGRTPAEIGRTADLLEYRITECQLGLFGYSPAKKIVRPAEQVPDNVREQLDRFVREGTVSCAACWKIADSLGLERMDVSAVCERLDVKVQPCQLGAF